MGRLSIVFIGLFIPFLFSISPAKAITIQKAEIKKGAVQVKGKGAAPGADISWEGQVVAQAKNNGTFRFSTPILPGDCVGELSDEAATVEVAVKFCGPAGAAGPQGPPGPPATKLVVLDASGTEVGRVIDVDEGGARWAWIAFRVNDYTFRLLTRKEGFGLDGGIPKFESADCSGTPLMFAGFRPNVFPTVIVGSRGHTAYLPDPDATPQNFPVESVLRPDGCDAVSTSIDNAVPAIPLVDLDTLFTPPFEFELQE